MLRTIVDVVELQERDEWRQVVSWLRMFCIRHGVHLPKESLAHVVAGGQLPSELMHPELRRMLLEAAIFYCPNHTRRRYVTDDNGRRDRVSVSSPIDPTLFEWLLAGGRL